MTTADTAVRDRRKAPTPAPPPLLTGVLREGERNPGLPLELDWVRGARVNRSAVERRAATLGTRRTVKKAWQAAWLLKAVTLMDLTSLSGDDTPARVRRLCAKAKHPVRLDTSDVPGGVVNIVTGRHDELVPTLAAHDDVDGIWYFGSREGSAAVERASTGNMKRTWVTYGASIDWMSSAHGQGHEFLREATQVKNIWIPYGE